MGNDSLAALERKLKTELQTTLQNDTLSNNQHLDTVTHGLEMTEDGTDAASIGMNKLEADVLHVKNQRG